MKAPRPHPLNPAHGDRMELRIFCAASWPLSSGTVPSRAVLESGPPFGFECQCPPDRVQVVGDTPDIIQERGTCVLTTEVRFCDHRLTHRPFPITPAPRTPGGFLPLSSFSAEARFRDQVPNQSPGLTLRFHHLLRALGDVTHPLGASLSSVVYIMGTTAPTSYGRVPN